MLAYRAVHDACETRVGKRISTDPASPQLTAEQLVSCLRRLRKSVDFWIKEGGRRGYLDFVGQYI